MGSPQCDTKSVGCRGGHLFCVFSAARSWAPVEDHFSSPPHVSAHQPQLLHTGCPSTLAPPCHDRITSFSLLQSPWCHSESRTASQMCFVNFIWSPIECDPVTAETHAIARAVSGTEPHEHDQTSIQIVTMNGPFPFPCPTHRRAAMKLSALCGTCWHGPFKTSRSEDSKEVGAGWEQGHS